MIELHWSIDLPKEEGMYWWRSDANNEPVILKVVPHQSLFLVTTGHYSGFFCSEYAGEWAGPIPEPKD